jgi:hypothetical protein
MTDGEQANLEILLKNSQRRLFALQQRAALMGISTPPEVTIEIEDLEQTVANIKQQLAAIQEKLEMAPAVATPQGQPKRQVTQEQINQLVDLLLACPSIADRSARDVVVQQLPPSIINSIPRNAHNRVDVWNIASTCRNYSGGINALIEAVRSFDKGTDQMQALDDFFR